MGFLEDLGPCWFRRNDPLVPHQDVPLEAQLVSVLVPDAEFLWEEALAGPTGAQGFFDLGVGLVLGQLELGEGDSLDVQGSGFVMEAGEGVCRLVLRARQILGVEVEVGEPFPPPFELAGLASTAWL